MGKKNKKNTWSTTDFMGLGKKSKKVMDRYGVEGTKYYRPDQQQMHGGNRTEEDVNREIVAKASNDYDTRRSLEALALAGGKKAKNWAKNGFKNAADVELANNMFKKLHKKNGNGGDFSSRSDFAGLTWDSVNKDRDQLIDGLGKAGAEEEDRGLEVRENIDKDDDGPNEGKLGEAKERAQRFKERYSGSYFQSDDDIEKDGRTSTPFDYNFTNNRIAGYTNNGSSRFMV